MTKTTDKLVWVDFTWEHSLIDPIQFKPLSPTLLPIKVVIRVGVPTEYLLETWDDGTLVFNPEGLAYISREIAKAIGKSYSEK